MKIMEKKTWKTLIDVLIMLLTALGGYVGASAAQVF